MNNMRITVRQNGSFVSVDVYTDGHDWTKHFNTRTEADAYAARLRAM